MKIRKVAIILAAVLGVGVVAPASGQRPTLAMLDQIESGRWELRLREQGGSVERICIPNGRRFIQLRHPDAACERLVVQDQSSAITVQYTCRGHGYGLTSIRKESSRLLQISSQGIANGLPFEFSAEARRVGNCPAA